jgi:hypothetical protein
VNNLNHQVETDIAARRPDALAYLVAGLRDQAGPWPDRAGCTGARFNHLAWEVVEPQADRAAKLSTELG